MEAVLSAEDISQVNAGVLANVLRGPRVTRIARVLENFEKPNVVPNLVTCSVYGVNVAAASISVSYGGRIETALVPGAMSSAAATETQTLEQRFHEEADKWDRETEHLSSPTQMMMHPSYQAILGMAREDEHDLIRVMLRDLRDNRRMWFWALSYLTKENPIKPPDAGKLDRMIKAWVDWGTRRGML